jgi:hypothetical protein
MEALHIIDSVDKSTSKARLYLDLYDTYARGEQFDISTTNMDDPELADLAKTIQVLQNELLYAPGYLGVR